MRFRDRVGPWATQVGRESISGRDFAIGNADCPKSTPDPFTRPNANGRAFRRKNPGVVYNGNGG